jgi:hypothetical protein
VVQLLPSEEYIKMGRLARVFPTATQISSLQLADENVAEVGEVTDVQASFAPVVLTNKRELYELWEPTAKRGGEV